MDTKEPKITTNRQKKMDIVTQLSEKFGKAKAVVFTNYERLTHKQIEGLKKAIKPLDADYVVAKNSLVTLALAENKITLSENLTLQGPTGTLFLYGDIVAPLKSLAKIIKELNLPNVKFGIMDRRDFITSEQVMKLSTLPNRETLLAQIAAGLKSPISGLHRALNWNLQKFVMTLNAIAASNAAGAAKPAAEAPVAKPGVEPEAAVPVTQAEVKKEEQPAQEVKEEVKIEGGEN